MQKFNELIAELKKRTANMYQKNVLLTWEKSEEELRLLVGIAEALKELRNKNISTKVFDSGLAVSLFRDNSTRTRFSYTSAANLLGLTIQDLDEGKSQISHGETVRETANMISFLTEVIGIRDDMYLGAGNKYMREVSDALDNGFEQEVLPQKPAIVNLQCDVDHPTQAMADLIYLKEKFGSLENLKGKKIAVTWAYSPSYGKPLSVPQGIIGLMTRFGMDVHLAHPKEYDLIPEVVEVAKQNAKESGGSFTVGNSMDEAFKDADIIYPKSWAPYWVMGKRTELLRNKDQDGLKALEKETLEQNKKHIDWETNADRLKLTKDGEALYMHPLPADISGLSCVNGEVSNEIFDKYRIDTYKEAGWKPYVIASMIFANKFENPAQVLEDLEKRGDKRKMF